ncbi:hypothetical protein GGP41_000390 [Bipolaris sorokiniana]|uniref:Uncharacterized protein n=2 Tax=Cochliobolus sativus TaxID=45130 RepID=A0A8H6DTP7_COCSA|nr:hypothetical protein GGP41_000390 [Bipolaris sorokiniana]
MISAKFLALALGFALGAQASDSPSVDVNVISGNIASANINAFWDTTWPKVQKHLPGIECSIGGHAEGKNTSDSCKEIEASLVPMFPGIHCTGNLDEVALKASINAPVTVLRRESSLERRSRELEAAAKREQQKADQQIDQKKRSMLLSCADAPHPGNCYTCVAAGATQALTSGGKCVLAFSIAMAALARGQPQPGGENNGKLWTGYGVCLASVIGDMGAGVAGCPLRSC